MIVQEVTLILSLINVCWRLPVRHGAVMTSVLFTVALRGGSPLSHTKNGILITEPTGKLELTLQFCSPSLAKSWPAADLISVWVHMRPALIARQVQQADMNPLSTLRSFHLTSACAQVQHVLSAQVMCFNTDIHKAAVLGQGRIVCSVTSTQPFALVWQCGVRMHMHTQLCRFPGVMTEPACSYGLSH